MSRPLRVLIVDDSADDAELVLDNLSSGGFEPAGSVVQTAEALADALADKVWDLVVSDHSMPQFDAPAALAIVRATDPDLPFIIVSGTINDEDAVEAMRSGAQDYLLKDNLSRLAAVASRELEEAKGRRERRAAEERIHYLVHHDVATGLPSRAWLNQQADEALGRTATSPRAMVVVGLERLRDVAQAFGQNYADAALVEVASRLKEELSALDVQLARIGEDRLGLAFDWSSTPVEAEALLRRVVVVSSKLLSAKGHQLSLAPRAGMAVAAAGDAVEADTLLRSAETALEEARRTDASVALHSTEMDEEQTKRLLLLADLQQAIGRGELSLNYQPQVDLYSGRVRAVEALLRWHHPTRGPVPADVFIPIAEQAGFMRPITSWVLASVVRQLRTWRDDGLELLVAMNASAHDLRDEDLAGEVRRVLRREGVAGSALGIEVTESTIVREKQVAFKALQRLNRLGIRTSIDDFGTGYSSLAYLRELPVRELKIDRSFAQDAWRDAKARAILEAITKLGLIVGLDVVAEGVNDARILPVLRDIGCTAAQGFHICRPLAPREFRDWLSAYDKGVLAA